MKVSQFSTFFTMKLLYIYIFIGLSSIWAYTNLDFVRNHNFGTNLTQEFQVQSPNQLGQGIIKARYQLALDWIEPVFEPNSDLLSSSSTYLRSKSSIETTPYYAQVKTGLGIQPIPLIELSIHYSNLLFYGSSVSLPLDNKYWDESTIRARDFTNSGYDVIQTLHIVYRLHYDNQYFKSVVSIDHQLIDIKIKDRIYLYDYSREIPIYPRDDLFELSSSVAWIQSPLLNIFLQNKFLLTKFEGDFSKLFNPRQTDGKPILYRNDTQLGFSYCNSKDIKKKNHSIYWLGYSEQSGGPDLNFIQKLNIGFSYQSQINFKEFRLQDLK